MSRFTENTIERIRATLVNARNEVDVSIPVDDEFTVHIESKRGKPVNKVWDVRVSITSTIPLPEDDVEFAYLHEISDEGAEFVDEWESIVAELPGFASHSWDFLIQSTYDCGQDAKMSEFTERISVPTEDLLKSTTRDEKLVRVSYSIPREFFVVVDEDVNHTDVDSLLKEIPNLGMFKLPVTELEPKMMQSSLIPNQSPDFLTTKVSNVDELETEVVDTTD